MKGSYIHSYIFTYICELDSKNSLNVSASFYFFEDFDPALSEVFPPGAALE
jgi:hypothetical protein